MAQSTRAVQAVAPVLSLGSHQRAGAHVHTLTDDGEVSEADSADDMSTTQPNPNEGKKLTEAEKKAEHEAKREAFQKMIGGKED